MLFYNGFNKKDGTPYKGHCALGGEHRGERAVKFVPAPVAYALVYDLPETPKQQNNWRYCEKCAELFYDGFSDKGHCPVGAGHKASGYNFVLEHDNTDAVETIFGIPRPYLTSHQDNWRYCSKCHALFYEGAKKKGPCSAGDRHFAQGFRFALLFGTRYSYNSSRPRKSFMSTSKIESE